MMALVPRDRVAAPRRAAGAAAFVGDRAEPKRRAGGPGKAAVERHLIVAREALRTGDWSRATPLTFVVLYELRFAEVYGQAPALTARERQLAAYRAAALLRDAEHGFADDLGEMAAFVIWVWKREREREQYRREHKSAGGVVGWQLQFNPKLVVDYNIQRSRTA